MIEINLLPQELRVRVKKDKTSPIIDPKVILYIAPLLIGVLLVVHILLFVFGIFKSYQLGRYDTKWQKLEPQRKELDAFKKQDDALSQDTKISQQLVSRRIYCSEKLNKLSLNLPSGVWFNEISITPKDFFLRGGAVSLKKEEMGLINKFMESLKKDAVFFKDFSSLELTSFQTRNIGGYDTVEFILSGTLK